MIAPYLSLTVLSLLYLTLFSVSGFKFSKLTLALFSSQSCSTSNIMASIKQIWKTVTIQQVLFFLLAITSLLRVVFFICAMSYWSSSETHLLDHTTAYYLLESACSICFYAVLTCMVLFMMEIYFVSTHNSDVCCPFTLSSMFTLHIFIILSFCIYTYHLVLSSICQTFVDFDYSSFWNFSPSLFFL